MAAIRAAQLGMKVACVEREFLGGTCLNIGCIPSKALLDSSERLYDIKHQLAQRGIKVGEVSVDLPTMMAFKDDVVKKMTGGVGVSSSRKTRSNTSTATARITAPGYRRSRKRRREPQRYKTKKILIATGSAPIQIPSLAVRRQKYSLLAPRRCPSREIPKKHDRRRRRIHRRGDGLASGTGSAPKCSSWNFSTAFCRPSIARWPTALQNLLEKQGIKFRFNTGRRIGRSRRRQGET